MRAKVRRAHGAYLGTVEALHLLAQRRDLVAHLVNGFHLVMAIILPPSTSLLPMGFVHFSVNAVRVQDAQQRSQRGSGAVGVVAAVDSGAQRLAEIPFARQQTQHNKGGVNGNVREVLHIIVIQNPLAHLDEIAQLRPPVTVSRITL